MSPGAGCRVVEVFDPVQQRRVPCWLLYPTSGAPRVEPFGPYPVEVAMNASVEGEGLPLVVLSHGNAGTPWSHRGLAVHLAREGFVVAAIEHPGNSRSDNSLADATGVPKVANLESRPRHVRLVADAAFADAEVGGRLRSGRVAVVGHSIGGYTALAAAGGRAMTFPDDVDLARRMSPDEGTARLAFPVATGADPRVRAAVLLAPALGWFMADDALSAVRVPLMVRVGERDLLCSKGLVERALRSVPERSLIDLVEVPNAGHFSFQSPFPPSMSGPHFPPSQDPPGFDRARYQETLQAEVAAFLRASLAG